MFHQSLRAAAMKAAAAASFVASFVALAPAAPAAATTVNPLYVDGGTAASYVYRAWGDAWGQPLGGGTCVGINCAEELLYASIGTGSSQTAFLNHAASASVPGASEPPYTDTLFPAYPYPALDLAAGDAPLNNTQLSQYNNTINGSGTDLARFGAAIVTPTMGVPIAVGYNRSNLTIPAEGAKLSVDALCGIFTGAITNWNDAAITKANGGVSLAPQAGGQPITVEVRSDGSGSTFILSDALSTQCVAPKTTHIFKTVTGGVGIGAGSAPVWPATFVASKGSGGVQGAINATPGGVGYVSANFVQPFNPSGPPAAKLQNKSNNYEAPIVANSKAALSGPFDTTGPCGTAGGVTTCYPNPVTNQKIYNSNPGKATAYPITGFTYGYFYTCSPSADVTAAINGSNSLFVTYALKAEVGTTLTPADTLVENRGLVELTNTVKSSSVNLLKKIKTGPIAGTCTL